MNSSLNTDPEDIQMLRALLFVWEYFEGCTCFTRDELKSKERATACSSEMIPVRFVFILGSFVLLSAHFKSVSK